MELLFELLLTAAATFLVAFLLAKLLASADPRHDRGAVGPAVVIAEEEKVDEEERIIEVKVKRAAAAPTLSEGWVEVEKAPPAGVAEGKAAWVAVEEGLPVTLAPEVFLGTVLKERKEEGEVGKRQRDLTAEAEVAAELKLRDLGDEAVPREILGLELEKYRTQQHDSGAEAAPSQVLDLDKELQKQEVQATEAVVVEQRLHVVAESAPAAAIDAGTEEEEGEHPVEVIPHELTSDATPAEVLDVVPEKQEKDQLSEVDQHELAAEVAPRVITDEVARELAPEVAPREITDVVARELAPEVAPGETTDEVARELAPEVAPRASPDVVGMVEEPKDQSVEEVANQHVEVQNNEEAQCELSPVDQQEKLVREEELAAMKADDLNVSQEGSSNDKVAVQLPEKEVTLPGMPEDETKANMEFEEWEGIERSEVEKKFGAAAAFAASDAGAAALSKLDSDVQLQLQGLLKVAIDGPCYDSTQPLTLRPSSRAKWVSWQKLGNMHPEIAMGKYMDLLSEYIPRWIGDQTSSTKKHEGDVDSEGAALTMTARTSDRQTNQGNEGSTSIDEGPLTSLPDPEEGQSSDIPAE